MRHPITMNSATNTQITTILTAYINQQSTFQPPKHCHSHVQPTKFYTNTTLYSNIKPAHNPVKSNKLPSKSIKNNNLQCKQYFQEHLFPTKSPPNEPPSHMITFCIKFTTYHTHTITEASHLAYIPNALINASHYLTEYKIIQHFNNYDYILVTYINNFTAQQKNFLNNYKTNLHILTIPHYLLDTSPTFKHAIINHFCALRNEKDIYHNNHKTPCFTMQIYGHGPTGH